MVDYANGSLTIPRVKVVWGPEDITANVYDVRVSLDEQGQTPTGSMKWIPTPNFYAKYVEWITKYKEWSIMITFYYIGGGSITFEFYWSGQSETYGNEMEITVKLVSLLDGLVNANFFASAQTNVGEKGINFSEAASKLQQQFGITGVVGADGQPLNILRYTEQARKDTEKAIVKFNYNDGSTFSDAVQNLVKDNGNNVFFNNIGTANAVVFTPYSWEEYASIENAIEPGWARKSNPDPTKRYGYFIGPGIIQTFTRTYEWQPPQKSQEITAMMNRKAEQIREANRAQRGNRGNRNGRAGANAQQSATAATATSGVYGSNISQNIRSENNEDGPRKQDTFTKERAAKLSLSTLMCPALTGLKPLDIIFIPSFNEEFIEDWIVSSVEYQQNEKGVDLSIQATRPVGQGEPMSPKNSERYLDGYAQLAGLSKSSSSKEDKLVNWMNFAWLEPLKGTRLVDAVPQTTSTPPQPETTPEGSVSTISANQLLEKYKRLDPSKAVTPIDNLAGLEAPGSKTIPKFVYKLNDPLHAQWLRGGRSFGKRYTIFRSFNSNGGTSQELFVTDNPNALSILEAEYKDFLKIRPQFAETLVRRLDSKVNSATSQPQGVNPNSPNTAPSPLTLVPPQTPSTGAAPTGQGATTTGATPSATPTTSAAPAGQGATGTGTTGSGTTGATAPAGQNGATPTTSANQGTAGANGATTGTGISSQQPPQPAPQPSSNSGIVIRNILPELIRITRNIPPSKAIEPSQGAANEVVINSAPFAYYKGLVNSDFFDPRYSNVSSPEDMLTRDIPLKLKLDGLTEGKDRRPVTVNGLRAEYAGPGFKNWLELNERRDEPLF